LLGYLFFTAPAPLVSQSPERHTLSTPEALTLLAHENDITRTLFTKAIVGTGKPKGLAFSEHWTDPDVIAGPLPALFLRGVAAHLAASEVPLGLYLGSDHPIESSNRFQGRQAAEFAAMRENPVPRHFQDPASGETIGMYPDWASAAACVSCHNEHERTSKTDWVLGDLMGATTWSYPEDSVTTDEFMGMLEAYRAGVAEVWSAYLGEIANLPDSARPPVGAAWPSAAANWGLPDAPTFQDSVMQLSAPVLLSTLLADATAR
jgi:hypothetical protein